MDYKVVFDLQTSDIRLTNYLFMMPGIAIFLCGALAYFFRERLTNPFRARPMPQRFPFFLLLFGLLWMQLTGFSLFAQYDTMKQAMKSGKVSMVEGMVTGFSPMPILGHKKEHFCVSESQACFSYSDYEVTPGFNVTAAHDGPIRNGLPVRVTYRDNVILKLELGKPGTAIAAKDPKDMPPPETALSPAR